METIGAILMVAGFILGVYGGLTFSRREVLYNNSNQLNKGKQFQLSIITAASALIMLLGVVLYFKFL